MIIAAAGASIAAMIVTPIARQGGAVRRGAAAVVVGGLAVTTFERLRCRSGGSRAGAATAAVVALGWAVEAVGSRTGRPFGRYVYTGRLRPTVGGVPVLVPLAWFAMAAPAREVAHAILGRRSTSARRVLLGAAAMTAWDLFLDPQMVGEGYWRWQRPGRYRGIPWTNFGGWIVTGATVLAVLEAATPPDREPDLCLVGEYAAVAAMETLGFAAFFEDRTVALVGGAAMVPLAAVALRRVIGESD